MDARRRKTDSDPAAYIAAPKPRRTRMSNVERTARTRKDLLEATISCLFRHGYGATTTHLVAEIAGLSRGAMVHHFPTKAALMEATVRYAWDKEMQTLRDALAQFEPGLPRFRAMIDQHWATVRRPEDTAINEVRIGSRSDPVLAKMVQPIMADIASDYAHYVGSMIREAGLEPDDELRGLTVTWALALPMMNFYRAANPNPRMEESLLATLHRMQDEIIERQTLGKRAD
jgi:AcrR family transcriptional regulator